MVWKPLTLLLVLGLLAALTAPALAQADQPIVADLDYDAFVEDSITEAAFFDWYRVQASAGDIMVIDMAAAGGLAPLIGLLNASGDLVARSEDGQPNASITLEFTIPEAGIYTIVATRVDRENGTTTGTYSLRLRRANAVVTRPDPYQDVIFRCEGADVTTAATVRFAEDPDQARIHRLTVYGIGDFRPVIRVNISSRPDFEICNTDAQRTVSDTFTLPGEETRTITEATLDSASQLSLSGANEMGIITLTIGSLEGRPGRYMAVIEGFSIEPGDDFDSVEVRVGPLAAATTSMSVYMVAAANSRLDPFMTAPDLGLACDDAGRRDCAGVPSFAGAGVVLHETGGGQISGDRNDAGLVLTPGNPDPITLELGSRAGHTRGAYALIVIGELPPAQP